MKARDQCSHMTKLIGQLIQKVASFQTHESTAPNLKQILLKIDKQYSSGICTICTHGLDPVLESQLEGLTVSG